MCAKHKNSFQALVTILQCNAHEKAFEHNFLSLSILCLVSHHIHVRLFYCFQSHYWQTQKLFLKNILLCALFGNNLAVYIFPLFTKIDFSCAVLVPNSRQPQWLQNITWRVPTDIFPHCFSHVRTFFPNNTWLAFQTRQSRYNLIVCVISQTRGIM